jgi:tetratricopeptide (TPR) repeat protein
MPKYSSITAVVVGVNYSNRPTGQLSYAEADARDIADVLGSVGFGVERLLGSEATRQAIIEAMEHQCLAAGRNGLVLFYFSGHGGFSRLHEQAAYLIPVDGNSQQVASSCIALSDLPMRYLRDTHTAIAILDCCHSGGAAGADAFRQQTQNAFLISPMSRVVFAACAEDTVAYETSSLGHGYFTYYILEYWRKNAKVNIEHLYDYVAEALENRKGITEPVRGGSYKGRIILPGLTAPTVLPAKPAKPPSQEPAPYKPQTQLQPQLHVPPQPLTLSPVDRWLRELEEVEKAGNWQSVVKIGERILGYHNGEHAPTASKVAHAYLRLAQAFRMGYSERIDATPDVSWVSSGDKTQRVRDAWQQQWEQDLAYYTRALQLWPNAHVYRLRGILYLRTGDYRNALTDFTQSIRLDPQQADIYAFRAESYHRQYKNDEAIADFTSAIGAYSRLKSRTPTEFPLSSIYYFRGVCYLDSGKTKQLSNRASNSARKDYESALADITEALNLVSGEQFPDKRRPEYYYGRGLVYMVLGQRHEARRDFERAGSSHLAAQRELNYLR